MPDITGTADVHRYRLAAPMININTVGAGGGSIAWLYHGILRVGPQSAEAVPGPACYMRGGTQATVTDADVVLGYLNPKALLGGKFKIDAALAEKAIREHVAEPLNMSVPKAALGIFEIVNRTMANGLSEISLERGYDPRDFVMVAAGGQSTLVNWRAI
jgi:N-methylhydantoinase A